MRLCEDQREWEGSLGRTKQGLKRWSYKGILHKTRIDEEMKTETESNLPWII